MHIFHATIKYICVSTMLVPSFNTNFKILYFSPTQFIFELTCKGTSLVVPVQVHVHYKMYKNCWYGITNLHWNKKGLILIFCIVELVSKYILHRNEKKILSFCKHLKFLPSNLEDKNQTGSKGCSPEPSSTCTHQWQQFWFHLHVWDSKCCKTQRVFTHRPNRICDADCNHLLC